MLWVKAFHIIAMIAWFSGLFYLPRLYVYHAQSTDKISLDRFIIMESKLYYYITMPAAVLTIGLGLILLSVDPSGYLHESWMQLKLSLVSLLVIYHLYLGYLLHRFKNGRNQHGHVFYRILNELPTLLLMGIIIVIVVRPYPLA